MPPRQNDRTDDTRVRIIEAAEQLYALHGIEGVSTRQIVQASGQRNNSAVTYHFGSTRQLVLAIARYRSTEIDTERARLIREMNGGQGVMTLEDVAVATLAPIVRHMASHAPSHYLRFVQAVLTWIGPSRLGVALVLPPAFRRVALQGIRLLDFLPLLARRRRLLMVFEYAVQQLAAWEARQSDPESPTLPDAAEEVVQAATRMLAMPAPEGPGRLHSLIFGQR
jgi:AcrR family transcriptional regulator